MVLQMEKNQQEINKIDFGRIIVVMYHNGEAKNVAYFNSRVQATRAMYEWIIGENNA